LDLISLPLLGAVFFLSFLALIIVSIAREQPRHKRTWTTTSRGADIKRKTESSSNIHCASSATVTTCPALVLLIRIRICICSALLKQTAPAWSSASVEQRMRTALRWPKIASTEGSILAIKLADFTQDQIMNSHARSDRYRHGSLQQPQTD